MFLPNFFYILIVLGFYVAKKSAQRGVLGPVFMGEVCFWAQVFFEKVSSLREGGVLRTEQDVANGSKILSGKNFWRKFFFEKVGLLRKESVLRTEQARN